MLGCLLSAFPENALSLFRTCDYWTCKELLQLNNSQKSSNEESNQLIENDVFNEYLNTFSYKKFNWLDVPKPTNLWKIQDLCKECLVKNNGGIS